MPPCMSALVCAGLPGSGGHHLSICKRRTTSRCANGFKREYRFGSWIGTCRRFGNLTLDVGTWDFKSKGLVGHSLRVTRLTSRSPRRIRRREVEMHVQMRSQKIANHLTLVRRQIGQNDVGLSRRRPFDHLYEELHKLLAGGILRRSRRVAAAITLSCPSLNKPLRNVSPSVAGQSSIPARPAERSSFC